MYLPIYKNGSSSSILDIVDDDFGERVSVGYRVKDDVFGKEVASGEPCSVEESTDDALVLCDDELDGMVLGDGFGLKGDWSTVGLRERVGVIGGSKV